MSDRPVELTLLAALAAAHGSLERQELAALLVEAGAARERVAAGETALIARDLVVRRGELLELTPPGVRALLDLYAAADRALDPDAHATEREACPSIPWLTSVRTCWLDAVSVNYAVQPEALAALLPAPLEPEIHKNRAWVQILQSSLRDLRPPGMPSLFGVCFYQVSYRAAVRYRGGDGSLRRGGYFVRSETNHPVMRAIGNALVEFKFHDFGEADMVMLRDGDRLTVGCDPAPAFPGGKIFGVFDTCPLAGPPRGTRWSSLEDLHEPLVECYDALGVDGEGGFLYILTIDRDPWNARFVKAEHFYSEYFDTGPLGAGASELDSVLHIRECAYRWRPLQRVRLG
jgi:hypothetical protein